MNNMDTQKVSWARQVPLRYEADVAVIGGGMAGVTAALAAARMGVKVILIERFATVGGNATIGGVGAFCGETAGQGQVFDEIIAELGEFQAVADYTPYPKADHRLFNHSILPIVLQELLLRYGVKLLLHTQFVDVSVTENGQIKECIVCGRSGPEALRARQFIDCTGEAQLAHLAGFSTMKGRPGDQVQLPMSMMFFVRHAEEEDCKEEVPPGWFEEIRAKEDLPMTTIWPNGPKSNAIKVKIPKFDSTDTESMTAAEIRGRRRMMEVLDYYQRVEKRKFLLEYCSPQIGIREGRRVLGDYVLQVEDLRAGRRFDDAIARGVYYLDAHKPDDDKRTYVLDHKDLKVPPYHIPLRCLIAKDAQNLMVAGRCLSADQLALSSARVMTTCSMMGQAAGITAAFSVQRNAQIRDIDPLMVRKSLEANGANLEL